MISVIIPNYNHALFLDLRINTILNQTFEDFEVIILDDCSTDNSREVINQYRQHPKVSDIVFNEANSGSTFKQWLKGIQLAKGEWILIAESDDWSEPTLLEQLFEGTKKVPDVTLSFCQTLTVYENGALNYSGSITKYNVLHDGRQFIQNRIINSMGIATAGCALFRKDIIAQMPDISAFKSSGDWKFWIVIASKGKVHESGKYLHYWRRHSNNTTTRPELFFSKINELYVIFGWARDEGLITAAKFKERCLFLVNFIYRDKLLDDPKASVFLQAVKADVAFPIAKVRFAGFCKRMYTAINRFTKKKLLNVFMLNNYQ
ncbi:MAG: glycosyltransferase family 2 protein [Chitinophagaceae bacterium]